MKRLGIRTVCVLVALLVLPWRGLVVFGQADSPGPEDLAATVEAPRTPEIQQLAKELGNDPVKIIRWVQSSVLVEPTFGIFKGGEAALDDRAANPADQAALAIAILRAAGVPARFVVGRVSVTRDVATKWLGYPGALDILQRAQTPLFRDGTEVFPNTQFTNAILRHIWVEFYVQGQGWIPADPSYKETAALSGEAFRLTQESTARIKALIDSATVDPRTSGVTGIDEAAVSRIVDEFTQAFQRRRAGNAGQLFQRPQLIVPEYQNLDDLKRAFPHRPQGVELRAASLPENLHLHVKISWVGLEVSSTGAQLADRRISLFWVPRNSSDASTIQSQGLLASLGSGVRLIPVITVDGEVKGVGQVSQPAGAGHQLRVVFEYPAGGQGVEPATGPPPGGFASLLLNWGHGAPGSFRRLAATLKRISGMPPNSQVPLEEVFGSLFHFQGSVFWFLEDFMLRIGGRLTGATLLRRPSVLLSGMYVLPGPPQPRIGSIFVSGLAGTTIIVSGLDRNSAALLRWVQGVMGSALEGRLFQMLYNASGHSTIEIIREANRQRTPLIYASPDTAATVISTLAIPQEYRDWALGRARSSFAPHLIMPTRPIRVGSNNLWGFYEFDPRTASGGGWIAVFAKGGVFLPGDANSHLFSTLGRILQGIRFAATAGGVAHNPVFLGGAAGLLITGLHQAVTFYYDASTVMNSNLPMTDRWIAFGALASVSIAVVAFGSATALAGIAVAATAAPGAAALLGGALILNSIVTSYALERMYGEVRNTFFDVLR